jgi:precorrin-3B synthase
MSLTVPYEIKGWCPGVQRPMQSGDGLLVRVRPWVGAFTLEQAAGLADIAATLGNGHIDLTRRANLQIRGLSEDRSPALRDALDRLGLLEAEEARNVMVDPLAGPEVRALALALGRALPHDLPPKFGCLVDGGGPLSIAGERADIALCMTIEGVAVRLDGEWRGVTTPDRAVAAALGDKGSLSKMTVMPIPGQRRLGRLGRFTGVAAPFGRLEATQLRELVELCTKAGASEIRLSPWRALYVDAAIEDTGLIVDDNDPLLRIEACPGAPACGSATVDTRSTARQVAALGIPGSIHVSGCAKGCARSAPADLVLVGSEGRYGVVRNGTARDRVLRTVARDELATLLDA